VGSWCDHETRAIGRYWVVSMSGEDRGAVGTGTSAIVRAGASAFVLEAVLEQHDSTIVYVLARQGRVGPGWSRLQ
jgi:hypothetical protein